MTTPGRKISIYAGQELARLFERAAVGQDGERIRSVSGLLAAVADRYMEVCRQSMPTLTRAEWGCIFDATNVAWLMNHSRSVTSVDYVWLEVAAHIRMDGADEYWQCPADLGERLRTLPYASALAVVDA